MKKLFGVVVFVCLSLCGFAQNLTTVTASSLFKGGALLPTGTICFTGTDASNIAIPFRVGGGGQEVASPYCSPVTNGAIVGTFQVANPANTAPQNINYRIELSDQFSRLQVWTNVQFTGATFNFDDYVPPSPPLPLGSSFNVLTVGNLAIIGSCAGCTSSVISQRTVTGTVNGANTIFTLPSAPPAGGLLLLENGLMLTSGSGNDFTITGNTITFSLAPANGAQLLAFY